ncbi:hypothetical protein DXG01_006655, partial [Tephrocybe rancida]
TGIAHFIFVTILVTDYERWPTLMAVSNLMGLIEIRVLSAHWILSFATNSVTTILITSKLWRLSRIFSGAGVRRKPTRTQKVLSNLIESGLLYAMFQLAIVVMVFTPDKLYNTAYYARAVVVSVYVVLTAMYPCFVVVLVNQHRSMVETFGFSAAERSSGLAHTGSSKRRFATEGHLSFLDPEKATDSEDRSPTTEDYLAGDELERDGIMVVSFGHGDADREKMVSS